MHGAQLAQARPRPVRVPNKVHARDAGWEDVDNGYPDEFAVDLVYYYISLYYFVQCRLGSHKGDMIRNRPVNVFDPWCTVWADPEPDQSCRKRGAEGGFTPIGLEHRKREKPRIETSSGLSLCTAT